MASSKPCPGCGQVVADRKEKDLCDDCRRQLARGRRLEIAEVRDDAANFAKYEMSLSALRNSYSEGLIAVSRAMNRPEIVAQFAEDSALFARTYRNHDCQSERLTLRRDAVDALRRLQSEVEAAIQAAYQRGKDDGENYMVRVARGDVSATDFNAKMKGIGER